MTCIAPNCRERHLGRFALYVSFFPILLAGPIERATSFLPQIVRPVQFYDYSLVNNDENFFFNSDHLNKTGVMAFLDGYLKQLVMR